jgi:hypothetical protein
MRKSELCDEYESPGSLSSFLSFSLRLNPSWQQQPQQQPAKEMASLAGFVLVSLSKISPLRINIVPQP